MPHPKPPPRALYWLAVGGMWFYRALAVGVIVLLLFVVWRCSSSVAEYDPPARPRPTPAEVREQEENLRIVEETCADWWAGYIELPDHQAQVCVDGGHGK